MFIKQVLERLVIGQNCEMMTNDIQMKTFHSENDRVLLYLVVNISSWRVPDIVKQKRLACLSSFELYAIW